MDPRLTAELELLKQIYPDELEIKITQMSVRVRVRCYPLLEEQNMEHHYEYDNPFMVVNFDVPNDYPAAPPQFSLESNHSRIVVGGHLTHISERLNKLHESMVGDPCLQDSLELIRSWLFSEVAKKNKHFRKRTHILSDDRTAFYDDDDDEVQENLMKKSQYTEVTHERFAAWMVAFRAEMKMKQERDPVFMRKKALLSKASGRMIFNDRSKELLNYFDDEKNEDDDEDVDVLREMQGDDEAEDENVEVDEGVFGDEDDLDDDDEEFMIDDN